MWFVTISIIVLGILSDPIFWLFVTGAAFLASRYEFHWAFAASIAGGIYSFSVRPSLWHAITAWLFLFGLSAIVVILIEYIRERERQKNHGPIPKAAQSASSDNSSKA